MLLFGIVSLAAFQVHRKMSSEVLKHYGEDEQNQKNAWLLAEARQCHERMSIAEAGQYAQLTTA